MKNIKTILAITLFLSVFSISCKKAAIASFSTTQNGTGTVYFNNTSTHADSYNWDFGDGTNSTETSPTHTYSALGSYNVVLTANSSSGDGTNTQNLNVQ